MNAQTVTLIAALIAALTSIITLGLYTRFAIIKERRMHVWQKGLERLLEIEEFADVVQEVDFCFPSPEVLENSGRPINNQLRHSARRLGFYSELAKAKHNQSLTEAIIVPQNTRQEASRALKENDTTNYEAFLKEYDTVQKSERI